MVYQGDVFEVTGLTKTNKQKKPGPCFYSGANVQNGNISREAEHRYIDKNTNTETYGVIQTASEKCSLVHIYTYKYCGK